MFRHHRRGERRRGPAGGTGGGLPRFTGRRARGSWGGRDPCPGNGSGGLRGGGWPGFTGRRSRMFSGGGQPCPAGGFGGLRGGGWPGFTGRRGRSPPRPDQSPLINPPVTLGQLLGRT